VTARLSELTASARRLALVGLAKNTGKTVTLATLLGELEGEGRRVGVTSIGRDGEERDVIDNRIEKPRIELPGGSLVATTDALLRASGLPHDLLEETDVRTPLGRVRVARLRGPGAIVLAGPSAAADVRAVSDAMLAHGADLALIDGAIDRRAASSPDVADVLIVATGAVLGENISDVVRRTAEAVALVRLPLAGDAAAATTVELEARFTLTAGAEEISKLLDATPSARRLIAPGALPERFLHCLARAAHRRRRKIVVVASDPTKVFLLEHDLSWHGRQGVHLQVLRRTPLAAITANPIAPRAHELDSAELRSAIEAAIPDVPVFDVLDASYRVQRESELSRPDA
jgi:hypothetical protein